MFGKRRFFAKKRRFFRQKRRFFAKKNSYRQTPEFLPPNFGFFFAQNLGKMAVKKLQGVFLPNFWATLVHELVSKVFLAPFNTPFSPSFPLFPSFLHYFCPFSPLFSPPALLSPIFLPPPLSPRFFPLSLFHLSPLFSNLYPFFLLPASFPPLLLPSCSLLHPSLPFFPPFFSPVPCRHVKQIQCGKLAFLGFS